MLANSKNNKKPRLLSTTQTPQQSAIFSPSSKTQSSQQSNLNLTSPPPRTKMIAFIDSLYSSFKLLNKLSQEESNNFQTEVIQMLIDEDECVDHELYQETVQKIGLGTFVLEVLGTVVQKRNKFKNQYQMNRNLQEIAKELEKQRLDLTKRKKELDKRELGFKKKEEQLIKIIKDKAIEIEQQTKSTLLNLQEETKKRIKSLQATLKSKQKQLTDKASSFKQSLTKLNDLQTKQKAVEQKLKLLERKEKQRKSKQATEKQHLLANQQQSKKLSWLKVQITNLQEGNKKLEDEISRLNKKIKTNEMAYRHMKEQNDKKLGKYGEVNERMRILGEEKESLQKKLMEMEQKIEQEKQISEKLRKSVDNLSIQVKKLNKAKETLQAQISKLNKQNQQLTTKLQTNTMPVSYPVTNPQEIFLQLDISKIQNPFKTQQHQHHQFINTDRQQSQTYFHNQGEQDMSILHHVAESIIVMQRKQLDNELNQLSRTVDIQKQILNWEGLQEGKGNDSREDEEQEDEESDDYERQRHYVMNMKKVQPKKVAQKIKNQNHLKTINNKQLRQKKISLKQQNEPSSFPSESILEQQSQLLYLRQSSFMHQKPQKINESNVALFNNYFASNSTQVKEKSNNSKTVVKSVHDQLLDEINSFFFNSESSDPCQALQSFNKQSLLNLIKQISSPQLKYPRTLVQPFLQFLLVVLEPCTCSSHKKSLVILFTHQLIVFLQQVLLKFEAIVKEIQEKSVVILSRILLSYENHKEEHPQKAQEKFSLKEKYLKSLKVKLLLEKDEFIKSNLRFLMEYE